MAEVDAARVSGITDRLRQQGADDGGPADKENSEGKNKAKLSRREDLDLDLEDRLEKKQRYQIYAGKRFIVSYEGGQRGDCG